MLIRSRLNSPKNDWKSVQLRTNHNQWVETAIFTAQIQQWEIRRNKMDTTAVIQSITTLFSEAYAGPPNPSSTWFIDNEPDSGILGIIAGVSATEASWSFRKNDPGTTIVAHVEHLRWSLAAANDTL